MKQRPMLFHRYNGRVQESKREVIGLIGTHRGAGVTHTALMLAFYMGEEQEKRTALLECNKHQDLSIIQEAYEWKNNDGNAFSFRRITCFREVSFRSITDIFCDNYECIVLDFGDDFKACREEFLRCTTKIVVGGRSAWDRIKLLRFVNATAALRGSNSWLYFIPQADSKTTRSIAESIKRKVFGVPMMAEPTLPSRLSYKFFEGIF